MFPLILRWFVGCALGSAGAWLAILNWFAMVRRIGVGAPSWIPLLGGALVARAALVQPLGWVARYWWVSFLVDAGSIPGLLWTVTWHVRRKLSAK